MARGFFHTFNDMMTGSNRVSVKTRKGSITVTGGGNIKMQNGRIWVDGVEVTEANSDGEQTALANITHLTLNGDAGSFSVDMVDNIVITGSVNGKVESRNGNIQCGDVKGDVETRNGEITCGNIGGEVKTRNGSIKHTKENTPDILQHYVPESYKNEIEQHFLRGGTIIVHDAFFPNTNSTHLRGERFNWKHEFYTKGETTPEPQQTEDFCTIKEDE